MKKIIIILVAILAILVGILGFAMNGSESAATLYKKAPHVNYNQLLDDINGQNLYYFYQESCSHCNNIKGDVADFYFNKPENIDFYLVDAADSANQDVWADSETEVQETGLVSDYSDIQIKGTPTLIELQDGKITQFLVGEEAIPSYLSSLNE